MPGLAFDGAITHLGSWASLNGSVMRLVSRLGILALVLAVAGCANPQEIREARAERDRIVCEELGFEPGTETYLLCILIQDTNRRVDFANSQLRFLESDLRRWELLDSRYYRRRW
jgi:hypothetical protein